MTAKRELTRDDIIAFDAYASDRKAIKSDIVKKKRDRRIEVGPVCTFYFESFETMWLQVQEMLYIEKGGEAQIEDELNAYNPLIPNGRELTATVMFEIDDPDRRRLFLSKLGGIEETAFIRVGDREVKGVPEDDVDRTTADGKASSVQFIHFPFSDEDVEAFRAEGVQAVLGFSHDQYGHMVVMPEAVRAALAADFD